MPFRILSSRRFGAALLAAGVTCSACLDWNRLENGACGDGFLGREEACDDGNRIAGDGCSDDCRIEPASCGDGRVNGDEDCDDANGIATDACVDCRAARCGDGQLWELSEQCDDANETDGDGCSASCKRETQTLGPRCGDGERDSDEPCDDGNTSNTDSCLNGCSFATCGDGQVRQGVEECDVAAASGKNEGCSKGCMLCGAGMPGSFFRAGNGHCYTRHDEAVTEQQARVACQAEGGDLWTVTSEAEGNDVTDKLMLGGRYWLGLLVAESGNSWVSGEGTKYTQFAAGEPSDKALRCVAVDAQPLSDGWYSMGCLKLLGYVCERSPAFVFPIDHHAYQLHTGALNRENARLRCVSDGGHLASFETEAERLFVGKNVGIMAWIDGEDAEQDGSFVWQDGSAVPPGAFAPGQPDDSNGSQGCLALNPGDKLADSACSEPHAFICELD